MNTAIASDLSLTATERSDILVVDDTVENLQLLSNILQKQGYSVRKALNGVAALRAVETVLPDLILLDIMMPDMDGYQVCRLLKENPATADIPIIFLSALSDAFDKVKAFEQGGVDYITKPFQVAEVLVRTRNQLELMAARQTMRQLNTDLEARVQERTQQLQSANARLRKMALHDELTDLPNRALFTERLHEMLSVAKLDSAHRFAVLFLDCDRFKLINDSLGHLIGDEVLVAVAQRLAACLSEAETLSRFGGDEFAILLPHVNEVQHVTQVADRLLQTFAQPFQIVGGGEVFISASLGIVLSDPSQHRLPEHLLRDADTAMYRAKASGKARYQIFNPDMHETNIERLQLETELRQALSQPEFVLHYQPIVALETGKIASFEALIRWQHPSRGTVPPTLFIPIAEETGLIVPIGSWVIEQACQQLRQWQQERLVDDATSISVNLSVRQFAQADLVQFIDRTLATNGLNCHHLRLEITESTMMNAIAAEASHHLRQRQVHLSIDDFGTGYSCLSYLHSFPVNSLKIDRSFVQHLDTDGNGSRLIPAILSMAHAMNLSVVAEGIETRSQLDHLRQFNCDCGQGYLFSRPLAANQMSELLASNPQW